MKAKNVNKGEKNSIKANIFAILGDYIKKHYQYLLLFLISFLAVSALNFVKVSTTETVANYSLDEFEIGQIADRTIISSKTILPDDVDTVSSSLGISSPEFIESLTIAKTYIDLYNKCVDDEDRNVE